MRDQAQRRFSGNALRFGSRGPSAAGKMSDTPMRGLDLNLLRVFDALFEERNVTRAARRLGLTQSAVSHALNRLRFSIGDDLFVRGPSGMRATPRAAEIGPRIREGLLQLGAALAPGEFTPEQTERAFSIAAGAYSGVVLLPAVAAAVRREAPRAEIRIGRTGPGLAEDLDAGRADLAVGRFTAIPDRFDSLPLFQDRMVWAMRRDHPLASEALTLDDLMSAPQVVLAAEGGHVADGPPTPGALEQRVAWDDGGAIRQACAAHGLAPPPTFVAPDTSAAVALLAETDLLALLPHRLAAVYADPLGLRLAEPPYPARPFGVSLVWRKAHDAAALGWLRRLIVEAATALQAPVGTPEDAPRARRAI